MRELSIDEKRLIYSHPTSFYGSYEFKPPPVCTANWSDDEWINYIQVWKPNKNLLGVEE